MSGRRCTGGSWRRMPDRPILNDTFISDQISCVTGPLRRFRRRLGSRFMRIAIAGQVMFCALLGVVVGMGGNMAQAQAKAQNAVLALDHGWQFRQVTAGAQDENGWLPATVPGDVHLDLLANKKIPDPFFRDNESKLQWIEKESWEYRTELRCHSGHAGARQCGPGLRWSRCGRRGLSEWRQGALGRQQLSRLARGRQRAICTPGRTCCVSSFLRRSRPPLRPRRRDLFAGRIRRPKRRPTFASRPMSTAGTGGRVL